jgi:outer membrane protein assembly factor BamB
VPFLFALELSRQAEELASALDAGTAAWRFDPGGLGPPVSLDLRRHTASLQGQVTPLDPRTLVRGMFEAGGELALAFQHQHRPQVRNPYLESLVRRCHLGLSALREPEVQTDEPTVTSSRRVSPEPPLPTPGTLKRLRFERAWESGALKGADLLTLGPKGPLLTSPDAACGLTPKGAVRFLRQGAHGVAVHTSGVVIAADDDRVTGFDRPTASATWLHDHDGLPLGPWLLPVGTCWLTTSAQKGLVAFDRLTGRERWRLMPPRTQRLHVALHDGLVWAASDAGVLVGIDPADGQARFRVRAPLPFVTKVLRAGKRTYALLGRGDQCGVVALDSRTRQVDWTVELPLSRATFLAHGGRIWTVGQSAGATHLYCLTATGKLLFQRALPLGPAPFHLLGAGRGIIATGRIAAAVRVQPDGELAWRLGPAGEPHAQTLEPSLARGLLLLPGEQVRLVDLSRGEVLAEIYAGPGLASARADRKLTLYLLNEEGGLTAHRLITHLAVVRASNR